MPLADWFWPAARYPPRCSITSPPSSHLHNRTKGENNMKILWLKIKTGMCLPISITSKPGSTWGGLI